MTLYLIHKADVDEKGTQQLSTVIDHSFTISLVMKQTEQHARNLISKTCGESTAVECKVIDILKPEQVNEPLIDTMLIYRITSDPHHLHVWRRTTKIVPGKLWSFTTETKFIKVAIFYFQEYTGLKETLEQRAFVPPPPPLELETINKAGAQVPAEARVMLSNMLKELVTSPKFQRTLNPKIATVNTSTSSTSSTSTSSTSSSTSEAKPEPTVVKELQFPSATDTIEPKATNDPLLEKVINADPDIIEALKNAVTVEKVTAPVTEIPLIVPVLNLDGIVVGEPITIILPAEELALIAKELENRQIVPDDNPAENDMEKVD